ncbi:bacteriocin immunity protein [Periweissella ghanensis]|uniref:Bacteriocin immunity protein n=1 Tax=Periweissella ghanensis TaxID=467997 RepID=A0ABN8BMP6_9LACO|nr:bacteriocin immunity protein [Periweissella ghanensis]MCM0600899.1 bacteriocin immunity protein [Periweissella ghanensis]CAH0417683.1 hypothetical protein WGH24286_00095 [Periweissella ghanensis]
MSNVNWFAGGSERDVTALDLINALLPTLAVDSRLDHVLTDYQTQLTSPTTAVPFILSQLNLAIANATKEDSTQLTAEQTHLIKQIAELSNIRYGY